MVQRLAKSITAHHLLSLAGMVREYDRKAQLPQTRPAEGVYQLGEDVAEGEELGDGLELGVELGLPFGVELGLGEGSAWAG